MLALPPEVRWFPDWMDAREAAALFDTLLAETPWEDPVLVVFGRRIAMPRRVAFYGPHDYAYSGVLHEARSPPALLESVQRRIAEVAWQPFNTLLMNLYRDGADAVSWHSDDDYPHAGHPAVASLSLGATRRFRFAHRRDRERRFGLDLTAGGLLLMEGRTQEEYRHALPRTAAQCGPRINLTFRWMAASNRG